MLSPFLLFGIYRMETDGFNFTGREDKYKGMTIPPGFSIVYAIKNKLRLIYPTL